MKQPLIGIVPLVDEARESYWMLPGYMQGVEQAGGVPVMLPLTDDAAALRQLADTCDGFLLTGGQDVSPALYGAAPTPQCGETCPARDAMEARLLDLALAADKPVLGICRGIQFLNVHLGGTLYQDLPAEHPSAANHHQTPPYDAPVHSVTLTAGSPAVMSSSASRGTLGPSRIRASQRNSSAEEMAAHSSWRDVRGRSAAW